MITSKLDTMVSRKPSTASQYNSAHENTTIVKDELEVCKQMSKLQHSEKTDSNVIERKLKKLLVVKVDRIRGSS